MTEKEFLSVINKDNDFPYDSIRDVLNDTYYNIVDDWFLGYDSLDDAVRFIDKENGVYTTIEVCEFELENELYYAVILKDYGSNTEECISIEIDQSIASQIAKNTYNKLEKDYYDFTDYSEIPKEYIDEKWSNNGENAIEVGIAPLDYFNTYDKALKLLKTELDNIHEIYEGVTSTTYRDDYTNDIVTMTYKSSINEICEKYFNDDIFDMDEFIFNNEDSIIDILMTNYEKNLIEEGYHHKIYYYNLGYETIDIDSDKVQFYIFDIEKAIKYLMRS